ncbi:hypothetical protein MTO96_031470 [Rhipicephalus appendiculatus]
MKVRLEGRLMDPRQVKRPTGELTQLVLPFRLARPAWPRKHQTIVRQIRNRALLNSHQRARLTTQLKRLSRFLTSTLPRRPLTLHSHF